MQNKTHNSRLQPKNYSFNFGYQGEKRSLATKIFTPMTDADFQQYIISSSSEVGRLLNPPRVCPVSVPKAQPPLAEPATPCYLSILIILISNYK